MSEKSGTDARFPYELRQNVVVGLVVFLLREQEVAGSNPVAPTVKQKSLAVMMTARLFSTNSGEGARTAPVTARCAAGG